jgi:hypothetical protein
MVNIKMVFYHPKKYKELHGITSRKCNTRQRAQGSLPANGALNSDQAISLIKPDGENESVRPGPGLKVSSTKLQAPSTKHQAFEPTCSIAKRQASQPE